jgi:hypothetical protein
METTLLTFALCAAGWWLLHKPLNATERLYPATTFRLSIPSSQLVSMKIFGILGREVATLVNEHLDAGSYRVEWNAADQTSGTYFAVIKTASHSETKKIILLK